LRALSAFAGFIVIIIYSLMLKYEHELADRISLRLVFVATVALVLLAIWPICVIIAVPSSTSGACLATAIFFVIFDSASMLLIMLVGVNLMLTIIFKTVASKRLEVGYYIFVSVVCVANGTVCLVYDYQHNDSVSSYDPRGCW
jgi:hypothetical protein